MEFLREPSFSVLYRLTLNGSDELKKELASLGIVIDLMDNINHRGVTGSYYPKLYASRLNKDESEFLFNQPLLWGMFDIRVVRWLDSWSKGREDFCWYLLTKQLRLMDEEPYILGQETTFLKQYIQGHYVTQEVGGTHYEHYPHIGVTISINGLGSRYSQTLIKEGGPLYVKLLAEIDDLVEKRMIYEYMHRVSHMYVNNRFAPLTYKEARVLDFNQELIKLYEVYQSNHK